MTVSPDEVRAIEFPAGIDGRAALMPLRTPTWQVSPDYRRAVTANSPLLFAITYMGRHLRQSDTGLMSFNRMHLDMCTAARRWVTPEPRRDAWIGPREVGKSAWLYGVLPLWALAHQRRRFFLAFASNIGQAKGHLTNMLDELRENELLLADFPGLALKRGQSSAERTVLAGGATLAARGMSGTSLGVRSGVDRPDLICGDDLEKGEVDNSPAEVEKNRSRLLRNILPMNTRAVVTVTGTVTMHGSLVHDLVDAAKGRDAHPWVAATGFQPHYYPALLADGSSLWPQRWPAAELVRMREQDPHGYALNYDNDPSPDAAHTYWTPDIFQYDSRFPIADRVLHADVAVTTNGTSDYTVLVLLGRDAAGRRALVERVEWGRWTAPQIRDRIHDMCEALRVKPLVRIESNQGGNTWLDSLAPWPLGVRYETTRASAPKPIRIRRAHAQYHRRAVWHPWPLPEFEAELCKYPRSKFDDIADSLAGALQWAFPVAEENR